MFMVISSWCSHCESSPVLNLEQHQVATSPHTKLTNWGHKSVGRYHPHKPSPFVQQADNQEGHPARKNLQQFFQQDSRSCWCRMFVSHRISCELLRDFATETNATHVQSRLGGDTYTLTAWQHDRRTQSNTILSPLTKQRQRQLLLSHVLAAFKHFSLPADVFVYLVYDFGVKNGGQ